eukprot:12883901-Prorocentrum_lima.AAC.1
MLFCGPKVIVPNNEFNNAPEVEEITLKRVTRSRLFSKKSSISVIRPPIHPGFFISIDSIAQ